MFNFFIKKTLISPNQSSFKTSYFRYEVRRIFLDISRSVDKVWQSDLLYKLRQNDIAGNLLNILTDFFKR